MNIDGRRRGAVAGPAGGGGDMGVHSTGDSGASSRGRDLAVGDWMKGRGTPVGSSRN
jgi:hypothetical protein